MGTPAKVWVVVGPERARGSMLEGEADGPGLQGGL